MIDLHTHSILSDGELLPSELARRARVNGCKAIAITDHVDHSNIDIVVPALVKVSEELNKYWDIYVIPGVEITHVPLECFGELVTLARKLGAKLVVGHGESPVEPVIPGTNAAAIKAEVDILAHSGHITPEDAKLAAKNMVSLEVTCRSGHSDTNKQVFEAAVKAGAKMVINTDAHAPEDIMTLEKRAYILESLTDSVDISEAIIEASEEILGRVKSMD